MCEQTPEMLLQVTPEVHWPERHNSSQGQAWRQKARVKSHSCGVARVGNVAPLHGSQCVCLYRGGVPVPFRLSCCRPLQG